MNDLTSDFREFRECARVVWNAFLRRYGDGEHDFLAVESSLFNAIVISQLARYEEPSTIGELEYYANLEVVPRNERAVEVLCSYDLKDHVKWERQEWLGSPASLRYRALFDFCPFNGEWREFRYVEAIVVDSATPTFRLGQRVLVESDVVRLIETP